MQVHVNLTNRKQPDHTSWQGLTAYRLGSSPLHAVSSGFANTCQTLHSRQVHNYKLYQ
eukprot:m.60013 g.60013  ORF g.60013 m.60013 type:complete len:58 (+) comp11792_c0_seq1:113-286(+)